MNTIAVLPPEHVELVERILQQDGVAVPALLKAQDSRPGSITLSAWVAGGNPICTQLPTHTVVCECQTHELESRLHAFSADLKQAQAMASLSVVT